MVHQRASKPALDILNSFAPKTVLTVTANIVAVIDDTISYSLRGLFLVFGPSSYCDVWPSCSFYFAR